MPELSISGLAHAIMNPRLQRTAAGSANSPAASFLRSGSPRSVRQTQSPALDMVVQGMCRFAGVAFTSDMIDRRTEAAGAVVRSDESWKASVSKPIRSAAEDKFDELSTPSRRRTSSRDSSGSISEWACFGKNYKFARRSRLPPHS
jgi:hypothetical protein